MTVIHIRMGSQSKPRAKPKCGDRKIIKGVDMIRVFRMANIGTKNSPHLAFDCTGGTQRYDWIPYADFQKKEQAREDRLIKEMRENNLRLTK